VIVCVCRNVSDRAIRAEAGAGARTAEEVGRATGAGTGCGCCRATVEAIVRASSACRSPPCPGCPQTANAVRRDAA
jgi:bacterioferritin-associated ferredoxin